MPREPPKKSRTLQQENRAFLSDWEEKYFQIEIDNKAHCFLCLVVISNVKSFNVERHHKIHSAKYDCSSKLYLSFEPFSVNYDSLLSVNLLFALINSFFSASHSLSYNTGEQFFFHFVLHDIF